METGKGISYPAANGASYTIGRERPAKPAPGVSTPAPNRVSDLSVAEYSELLRKNSFWGQLGDSLWATWRMIEKIVAWSLVLGSVTALAVWLATR